MNIGDLSHQRLSISLKALNQDPNVSPTIKAAFKTFYECMHDHKLAIDIVEQELCTKASSSQLHYGLSQKLAVPEFIKYFEKVEKIVEGVQQCSGKQEQRLEGIINSRVMKIGGHLQMLIGESKKEYEEGIMKRMKNGQQLCEKVRKEVGEIREEMEKIRIREEGEKENMDGNRGLVLQDKKYKQLIEEVRVIQQYCEENKYYVDQLVSQNMKMTNMEKYVDFNDLRTIVNNIETTLTQSLHNLIPETINGNSHKALWKTSNGIAHFHTKESNKYIRNYLSFENEGIVVKETGVYHIVCGLMPTSETQIEFIVDGQSVISYMCKDIPKLGLCRTLMFYISVEKGSEVVLNCISEESSFTQGFISISQF